MDSAYSVSEETNSEITDREAVYPPEIDKTTEAKTDELNQPVEPTASQSEIKANESIAEAEKDNNVAETRLTTEPDPEDNKGTESVKEGDNTELIPVEHTASPAEISGNESFTEVEKDNNVADTRSTSDPNPGDHKEIGREEEAENSPSKVEETHEMCSASEEHEFNETFKEAEKKYFYFWEEKDFLSQWHKSEFELNDQKYCCAEQYMMYMKAVLSHDDRLAKRILGCENPRRIKSLGRQTEQFSEDLWVHNCLHVVKQGNLAKFRQNQKLKESLFSTYPCVLVEASPFDKVWGIGLKKWDPCAWNQATWEGKNLLGYLLTEVRDELMCEDGVILESDKKVYFDKLTEDLKKNSFGRQHTHDRIPRQQHFKGGHSKDNHSKEAGSQKHPESNRRFQHHSRSEGVDRNEVPRRVNIEAENVTLASKKKSSEFVDETGRVANRKNKNEQPRRVDRHESGSDNHTCSGEDRLYKPQCNYPVEK